MFGELAVLQALSDDVDRHIFLRDLRDADEPGYWRLLGAHGVELMPVLYTPTVGAIAAAWHALPLRPRGLTVSSDDAGRVAEVLAAWPSRDVRAVVLTDGERVLGLGDLGAGGLAISEGKCTLMTVCAGLPPGATLPLCLDVGTDNAALRDEPSYGGLRRARLRGSAYAALVQELVTALAAPAFNPRGHVVLQWEDFGGHNAFELLERYRHSMVRRRCPLGWALLTRPQCCFNDDIQGTAAVAVAALLNGLKLAGVQPPQARLLFHGAGEAGTGIATLWTQLLQRRWGVPAATAARACALLDSKGLLCATRSDAAAGQLPPQKVPWAHPGLAYAADLEAAVRSIKPHALVGVSAQAGAFTPAVLALHAAQCARPIVMPLSNPTSLAECTAAAAIAAAPARLIFASGSPFAPIPGGAPDGSELRPSQANNAYIFPALALAASECRAATLTDGDFLVAAEALAACCTPAQLRAGQLFPPLERVRDVAARVAGAVAAAVVRDGRGSAPRGVWPGGWVRYLRRRQWDAPEPLPARL